VRSQRSARPPPPIPCFQEHRWLNRVRPRGKPHGVAVTHRPWPSVNERFAAPRDSDQVRRVQRRLGPIPLEAVTDGCSRGEQGQVGRQNRILEIQSHTRECA